MFKKIISKLYNFKKVKLLSDLRIKMYYTTKYII